MIGFMRLRVIDLSCGLRDLKRKLKDEFVCLGK